MRDLHAEYLAGAPDLLPFYAAPPQTLLEAPGEPVAWDVGLREALQANAGRLRGDAGPVRVPERGIAIVTGQQPGLFTGPLYTIYKACTAVVLARRIEERHGVPCMPVFWLGSDDHDFEETRTAHVLTKEHEPLELRYEPSQPVDGLPMFEVPLDASLQALIDRAVAGTPGSEWREPVADVLRRTLAESRSLAEWTGRLLGWLFARTPLVHFAPHWSESRRLAAPVLARELEEPLRSTALLNEAGARLQALGFTQQVVKAPDECNFFLFVNRRRCKVLFRDGLFVVPEESRRYEPGELRALLRDAPDRFSPNVALRCVVQQHLFGAAAYVAGPGEIAYWAELKPVFDHFGVSMPVVYPRAAAALTTLKLNKLMRKLGLTPADLLQPRDVLLDQALRRVIRSDVRETLQGRRGPVEAALASLADSLASDPGVGPMAASLRERVGDDLDRMERTLVRGDRAQVEAVERQVDRLLNALAPWRKPQERVYTVFSFLFEHGPGLIQRLIDELDVESFRMNEVEL